MPINTIYKLDKVVLASGQELHALNNSQTQFGIKSLIERSAGEVWPNFRANQEQKPMVNLTTKQLSVLLTNVPIDGTDSLEDIACYLKRASGTGSVARATAVHERGVIAEACVYWTSVRLPHNGPGEAQVVIVPIFDGTNDPIVFTGSVSLPGTLTPAAYFGAGPVSINGTPVPGVQEITIESGIKILQLGDGSEEFDTFVGIETGEAVITLKTLEQTNWPTLGLRGTALNGTTGIVCYGRKFAANGSRVANATGEHLKFVGLNGTCLPVDTNGQDSSPVTDTLRVELIDPTSASGLTTTVGSAIT
jgi:hypothetical protein